jgi:hypothetical protein
MFSSKSLLVLAGVAMTLCGYVAADAYDPKLATYCADLSEAAYQSNPAGILPWLTHVTVHDDQWFADSRAVVGVDETRKYIVVFFRGSKFDSTQNWIDNLSAIPAPWPTWLVDPLWKWWDTWEYYNSYKAHNGFVNHWGSMYYEVKANLEQLLPGRDDYEIIFTGHSLGGTAAELGALDLHHMMGLGSRKPLVYTFGQPRVFNYMLTQYYNSVLGDRTWRVTYRRDLVPHLPACGAFDFYEPCMTDSTTQNTASSFFHTSQTVHYEGYSDDYTICTGNGEDPACAYRYWHVNYDQMSVDDHLSITNDVVFDDQCLTVRLTSLNDGQYLQNNGGLLYTEATANDQWHIIPGLANPDCYSFESVSNPGQFMRHFNYRNQLGDESAYDDATFCVRDALKTGHTPNSAGEKIVSLEANNIPGHYVRHANNEIFTHNNDGSDLFKWEASWRMSCI